MNDKDPNDANGRAPEPRALFKYNTAKAAWGDLEPVPFLKWAAPISFRGEVPALLQTLKNTFSKSCISCFILQILQTFAFWSSRQ